MTELFQIIVEGDADKKFVQYYLKHLSGKDIPTNRIVKSDGKDNLFDETTIGRLRQGADNGMINLVLFDADKNPEQRRNNILAKKEELALDFHLFLLPNDKDCGALEDLLENVINHVNQPVMDCWKGYEEELGKVRIPSKIPPELTIPAKKTKIYAYLETLLGESRSQKKLIKDANRDYTNVCHWDLDSGYLSPLKEFLTRYLFV